MPRTHPQRPGDRHQPLAPQAVPQAGHARNPGAGQRRGPDGHALVAAASAAGAGAGRR
eukprot:SAG22_NODE_2281_length_2760_cov_21.201052_1_plen_57_part_10